MGVGGYAVVPQPYAMAVDSDYGPVWPLGVVNRVIHHPTVSGGGCRGLGGAAVMACASAAKSRGIAATAYRPGEVANSEF